MTNRFYARGVLLLIFATSAFTQQTVAQGPISPYFLTDGDHSILQVVQAGAVVNSWSTGLQLYPLAVSATVQVQNVQTLHTGVEYTLVGTPTGVTYPGLSGPTGLMLDGTTDGVAHNYVSDDFGSGGDVWQFDLNWNSPVKLFSTLGRPYS